MMATDLKGRQALRVGVRLLRFKMSTQALGRIGLWAVLSARTVRSALRDDFGIAASSIALAAFLAMIPLAGVIAGVYGMVVPPTAVADNMDKIVAILPVSARQLVAANLNRGPAAELDRLVRDREPCAGAGNQRSGHGDRGPQCFAARVPDAPVERITPQ